MRNLITKDVFSAMRLIKALDLKEEIKAISTKQESQESLGFELLFTIFEKASEINAEKKLYEFLSGPLEMKASEIEKMDLLEMVELVTKSIDIENWKSFFTSVSTLIAK